MMLSLKNVFVCKWTLLLKKIEFFLIIFLAPIVAFPQQDTVNLLQKYLDTSHSKDGKNYYYLHLNNLNANMNFTNRRATRILCKDIFIIEKKQVENLHLAESDIKYLVPANNQWKLSPAVEKISFSSNNQSTFKFIIALKNKEAVDGIIKEYGNLHSSIYLLEEQNIISVFLTYKEVDKKFLNNESVVFIDVQDSSAKEELATPQFDFSLNKINSVHFRYPLINGIGQNISIKEQSFDTNDIDIQGRRLPSPNASAIITDHATLITTIAAGGGNSLYLSKGVAWASNISSTSFDHILPDANTYYLNNNISVQNHSYGSAVENIYGLSAVAFDKNANDHHSLLHVFSAGNSGDKTSLTEKYAGVEGFANLTGSYKMAKNIILVGAVDSFGTPTFLSSRGPANDGRLKPEVVAFQKNGTSESAALVSGTTLLLQQYYKSKTGKTLPSALAKAILINTADDVNTPGPDYTTGYGSINALKAMNAVRDSTIFSGSIAQGDTKQFIIKIPLNIEKVRVSLVWNDVVATSFAPKVLINDLDLCLTSATVLQPWLPWVLNTFPNKDSLSALPLRKKDSLNNVEQITIDNPEEGEYQINISGYAVTHGEQQFYVVYSFDTARYFQWQYPTHFDYVEAKKESILRWENTFPGTGNIEYKTSSNSWVSAIENVDLSKKYCKWIAPDTIQISLLRMKIDTTYFYSDTIFLTSSLNPKVSFVCSDSTQFYWNKISNIDQYEVYQLGQKYMELFIKTLDTSVTLPVSGLTSKYFSVAPIFNGRTVGLKSYAFNYTIQGTGCFIKTFFVQTDYNIAKLLLSLGTTLKVNSISFEKLSSSRFTAINTIIANNNLDFSFDFQGLSQGVNIFRAKVTLNSGQVFYSNIESVYFTEKDKYLIFPVPVGRNRNIEIFTSAPDDAIIELYDLIGRAVLRKPIRYRREYINTSLLPPGEYFYRISKQNKKVVTGRLLIE